MKVLLQRVQSASVSIDNKVYSSINKGLLVFLGISSNDTLKDVEFLVDKVLNLRIFSDENGKFNFSISDIEGELLIVSQFTLYADCSGGRRPSFTLAARPEEAEKLYNAFVNKCRVSNLKIEEGKFQAHMEVALINDGPVTIMLES